MAENFDVICIQETWLKPSDPYNLNLPNYTLYRKDRTQHEDCRRGGVCTYVLNSLPHRQIPFDTDSEILVIEIGFANSPIAIINMYAPISQQLEPFHQLEILLPQISRQIIICADMNAHHPLWGQAHVSSDPRGETLYNIITSNNLFTLNNEQPTRIAQNLGEQNTSPDVTLASNTLATKLDWDSDQDPVFSDHCPITLNYQGPNMSPVKRIPRWILKRANWTNFTNSVEQNVTEFQEVITPEAFSNIVIDCATENIPKTKQNNSSNKKQRAVPWWTEACQISINNRNHRRHRYENNRTEQNFILYNKAKAQARLTIKLAKKESWKELSTTFNRFTPVADMFNLVKIFQGRYKPRKLHYLLNNGAYTAAPEEVAKIFADQLIEISSKLPKASPNPIPETAEIYNEPFTLEELKLAVSHSGNTSVGPDDIHYSFLKHLSDKSLLRLLETYNQAWTERKYPESWFHSFIVPIPKPNKDHSLPENYRPISLSSCFHKIFERMVKARLTHFTETNPQCISPIQSGFIRGRSTTDNLVLLVSDIQHAFGRKQVTAATFLDLKKAFDSISIQSVLDTLTKLKLSGNMAHYLTFYLTHRSFQVKIGETLSEIMYPTTGMAQGAVLSPLIFILTINSVLKDIPSGVNIVAYCDDLALWSSHKERENAISCLQTGINKILPNLQNLNLEISATKTQAIIFQNKHRVYYTKIKINGKAIPYAKTITFLGMTLDNYLSFNQHLTRISKSVERKLNLMRALTGTYWGADTASLLLIFKSTIRSVFEYSSIVFENAASSHLQKLDRKQNEALRIATGAFKTSPLSALAVLTHTAPLSLRRNESLLRYDFKIQLVPNHPCIAKLKIRSSAKYLKRGRTNHKVAIGARIKLAHEIYKIDNPKVAPLPSIAWWNIPKPKIEFLFTEPKFTKTEVEINQLFNEYISENRFQTIFYTDGSKDLLTGKTGAGLAIHSVDQPAEIVPCGHLPATASILSAELTGIYIAYRIIMDRKIQNSLIATDSKSSLQSLQNFHLSKHPIVYTIMNKHVSLTDSQRPRLIWIPGHSGLIGNEQADRAAKSAANESSPPSTIPRSITEHYSLIRNSINTTIQSSWDQEKTQQLHSIKPTFEYWPTMNQNTRKRERTLSRLRIGHTYITHSFLWNKEPRPICNTCNITLNVKHILLKCNKYDRHRQSITQYCQDNNLPLTLQTLLNNDHPNLHELVFEYLEETDLISDL